MARRGRPTALAQPPWTYAPKEVAEWLSSGVERSPRRKSARPRVIRETVALCSRHVARRALRRFDGLIGPTHPGKPLGILSRSWRAATRNVIREGKHSGVSIRLTIHWRHEDAVVRLRFRPPLSRSRAHRFLTELGLGGDGAAVF